MSNINHITFGASLRTLREKEGMPLRKLASVLDIDQSTLSKIERGERKPARDLIEKMATVFNIEEKELRIHFISDIIAYELMNEEDSLEVLKLAEEKLIYLKANSRKGNK